MSTNHNSNLSPLTRQELSRRRFILSLVGSAVAFTLPGLPGEAEAAESPYTIQAAHRAIDNQIDGLLALKAQLIKAQLAGVKTIPLEDPITGKVYETAISLAIDAVEFAANLRK